MKVNSVTVPLTLRCCKDPLCGGLIKWHGGWSMSGIHPYLAPSIPVCGPHYHQKYGVNQHASAFIFGQLFDYSF